ncbi:hypothetical protein Glove_13g253 [Diversispora epigaea]|uniref:Uncharacterized protein n=1 Tax=Diversispora epigaea TaxID=1348612 RepID=A0A397JMH1_9GLOM|nr:hypothetical protein Glove_13g253 [Diversispora epigaea]
MPYSIKYHIIIFIFKNCLDPSPSSPTNTNATTSSGGDGGNIENFSTINSNNTSLLLTTIILLRQLTTATLTLSPIKYYWTWAIRIKTLNNRETPAWKRDLQGEALLYIAFKIRLIVINVHYALKQRLVSSQEKNARFYRKSKVKSGDV